MDASRLFGQQVEGIAWRKRGYLPEAARRLMAALAPDAPAHLSEEREKESFAVKR